MTPGTQKLFSAWFHANYATLMEKYSDQQDEPPYKEVYIFAQAAWDAALSALAQEQAPMKADGPVAIAQNHNCCWQIWCMGARPNSNPPVYDVAGPRDPRIYLVKSVAEEAQRAFDGETWLVEYPLTSYQYSFKGYVEDHCAITPGAQVAALPDRNDGPLDVCDECGMPKCDCEALPERPE